MLKPLSLATSARETESLFLMRLTTLILLSLLISLALPRESAMSLMPKCLDKILCTNSESVYSLLFFSANLFKRVALADSFAQSLCFSSRPGSEPRLEDRVCKQLLAVGVFTQLHRGHGRSSNDVLPACRYGLPAGIGPGSDRLLGLNVCPSRSLFPIGIGRCGGTRAERLG